MEKLWVVQERLAHKAEFVVMRYLQALTLSIAACCDKVAQAAWLQSVELSPDLDKGQ